MSQKGSSLLKKPPPDREAVLNRVQNANKRGSRRPNRAQKRPRRSFPTSSEVFETGYKLFVCNSFLAMRRKSFQASTTASITKLCLTSVVVVFPCSSTHSTSSATFLSSVI